MARWTGPKGWAQNLGAHFHETAWEGRCGLCFQLETKARRLLENDEAYRRTVLRLQWIACLYKESNDSVRRDFLPSPESPWFALELLQRQNLVAEGEKNATNQEETPPAPSISINNKIQAMRDASSLERAPIVCDGDGVIVIPAASTTTHSRGNLVFQKSFLEGGQQLSIPGASVEYNLDGDILASSPTPQQYKLTCRFCTVHRHGKPLLITIRSVDSKGKAADVSFPVETPYTVGMWEETEPVQVEMGGPGVTMTTVIVGRGKQFGACTIKDLKLVPV
jgi:hypothetical protein